MSVTGAVDAGVVASGPASAGVAPLLELRSVDAAYGPFRALFGVSLTVRPGTVTALLGANGAGKTTVARVATGLVRPTAGEMSFEGDRIAWPARVGVGFFERWFSPAAWVDRRADQPRGDARHRGLACPVRTKERHHRSRPHFQRHAEQCAERPVGGVHRAQFQEWGRGRGRGTRGLSRRRSHFGGTHTVSPR